MNPRLLSAALLALPPLLSATLAAAVPVDLRTPSLSAPAAPFVGLAPAAERSGMAADLGARMMATRELLDEKNAAAVTLLREAGALERDASALWSQWRAFVPPPQWGAGPCLGAPCPLAGPAPGPGAAALGVGPMAEPLRESELLALTRQAAQLSSRAASLRDELRRADRLWWELWRALDAGREPLAEQTRRLENLEGRLRRLAADNNALDESLPQAQARYDLARPLALEHLQSARGAAVALPPAAHWDQAMGGPPRPDLRYDFESRYEGHLERSRDWLRRRRAPR
ncbi:MAG: hypothetical protein SF051_00335 [Elusimicrobiota bacterium]|nr:hypothetical protein [Elusimicrobiota bacterium]